MPKATSSSQWRPRDSRSGVVQGPAGSGELLLQAREIRMLLCAQAAQGGGCLQPWKASSHPQLQTLARSAWCQMQ